MRRLSVLHIRGKEVLKSVSSLYCCRSDTCLATESGWCIDQYYVSCFVSVEPPTVPDQISAQALLGGAF